MTGNNILLDTNMVIELFKGNPAVTDFLETQQSVDIPFAVLGELLLGAYRSSNPKKHIGQIEAFLNKCNVLPADQQTADHYAVIKAALLKKGKPIPENDMWIAAVSKQFGLKLHTADGHFKEISGLDLHSW